MAKNHYTDEFKQQIVGLYKTGKTPEQLSNDYRVGKSTVWKLVHEFNNSGSFKAKDNRSSEENRLIALEKENKTITNGKWYFKASHTDNRQKIVIIKNNKEKYSITNLCKTLKVARSTFYYQLKSKNPNSKDIIDNAVIRIFLKSRKNYGTRKIKIMLKHENIILSRTKISKIMQRYNLISNYTKIKYKHQHNKNVTYKYHNLLNQDFNNYKLHEVFVSDLTQVTINSKWYYICFLIDLFNREIISYNVSSHKNTKLVENTFKKLNFSLDNIKIFHTDQGSEFNNNLIYQLLTKNNVAKSYSKPGCPYDNAVSESTYKILKTELIKNRKFKNIEQFKLELFDYVNWYNNVRIHSKLNYLTPIEYKNLYSI